jgi:hypothetical protein
LNNYRLNTFAPNEPQPQSLPDLIPSYLRFNQASCPASIGITARIGNGGSLVAPTGVNVSFYGDDPAAGGALLGTVQTSIPLDPGRFEDVLFTWASPVPTVQNIFVRADDNGAGVGAVQEGFENNNTHNAAASASCSCVKNLAARPKANKVGLTWTWKAGAHHYNVYRATVSGGPYVKIGVVQAPGLPNTGVYTDLGLTNGTTYYYVVREAAANDAELCQSNQASAKPMPLP